MSAYRALLLSGLILGSANAAAQQESGAPTSNLIVEVAESASSEDLARARRQAGVTAVQRLPSINAEIWQVPLSTAPRTISRSERSRTISAAGYLAGDYRTLFESSSAVGDLTPAQTRTLAALEARPEMTDVRVVRLQPGRISSRMLLNGFDAADGMPDDGSIRLNLAGTAVTAVRRNLQVSSADSFEWAGEIVDPGAAESALNGSVSLVVRGDRIIGTANYRGETYAIRPLGGGLHAVSRLDQSRLPPEHPPMSGGESPALDPAGDMPPAPFGADLSPPVLSVGVVVTPDAERKIRAEGVTVDELVALALVESNEGLANSRIPASFALAGIRREDFTESSDWDGDLAALAGTNDGRLDAIHQWRDEVRANIVVMLTGRDEWCGLATGFRVPRDRAFVLVRYACATGYYSFAHEIGHLLGARHDEDTDPTDTPYSWGHGYRYQTRWRTIMAYGGGACGSCPRINAWANPDVLWDGVPMGTAQRNNDARVIAENAPIFSRY